MLPGWNNEENLFIGSLCINLLVSAGPEDSNPRPFDYQPATCILEFSVAILNVSLLR